MRQDFNWSELNRDNLYSMLYSAGSDIVGQDITVNKFHRHLSKHIKSQLPVSVKKWQYDAKQDRGFPYMGGAYDSGLDKKGKKRFIEVVLSYNPKDQQICINKYRWTRICSLFSNSFISLIDSDLSILVFSLDILLRMMSCSSDSSSILADLILPTYRKGFP